MSKLVIVVPRGRAFCGRAMLIGADGITRAGPFRALATASVRVARKHDNEDASPLLPFGHPPSGSYVVAASLPPGYAHTKRTRRYGRVGALLIAPRDGDALRARANGRKLIAIHGGPRDEKRRLRPTRGGIRLSNTNISALLKAINAAHLDGDTVESVDVVEMDTLQSETGDARGNHTLAPRHRPTAKNTAATTISPMFLLPFALGGAGTNSVARRDVLRAVAIAFGALAIQACERSSPCDALACDVGDDDSGRWGAHPSIGGGGDDDDAGDGGCNADGYACDGGVG